MLVKYWLLNNLVVLFVVLSGAYSYAQQETGGNCNVQVADDAGKIESNCTIIQHYDKVELLADPFHASVSVFFLAKYIEKAQGAVSTVKGNKSYSFNAELYDVSSFSPLPITPVETEVRYFNSRARQFAEEIASSLGVDSKNVIPDFSISEAGAGEIEVWLGDQPG